MLMAQNRLNLNFSLTKREERIQYISEYLTKIPFTPTSSELDMMAKYILWGENEEGLNGRQEGLQLETASKTWDEKNLESLDALVESPTFNESSIRGPSNPPTKIPREVFNRSTTRKSAPPYILETFETLWRKIDETELLISFYELEHDRRTSPIRQALLDRFTEADLEKFRSRAQSIQPYTHLKLKHQLVDLRREQYTIRDSYAPVILSQPTVQFDPFSFETFDTEIPVFPLGIKHNSELSRKIFRTDRFPEPGDFSEEELGAISNLLWTERTEKFYFDFGNEDHLYGLFGVLDELQDAREEENLESNLDGFLDTLECYWKLAKLEPVLEDILEWKILKRTNQQIADFVNGKYKKTYKPNYISTLYCKKCLGDIAAVAKNHREVMENIFFPENFKKCKDCGEVLLLNEKNFVKRHRSNDGFSPRCKKCEKIMRNRSK